MAKTKDLFISTAVHVRRNGVTVQIPSGLMLTETDLSAEEVASLMPHGVLRPPTFEEFTAVQARIAGETPALAAAPVVQGGGIPGAVKERR